MYTAAAGIHWRLSPVTEGRLTWIMAKKVGCEAGFLEAAALEAVLTGAIVAVVVWCWVLAGCRKRLVDCRR